MKPYETVRSKNWLKDRVAIRTHDLAEFHAYIAGVEGPVHRSPPKGVRPKLELRRAGLGRIEIALYIGNVEFTAEASRMKSSAFLIQFPIVGHFEIKFGDQKIDFRPGEAALIGPAQRVRRTAFPGTTLIFRVPVELVHSEMERRWGPAAHRQLAFEPVIGQELARSLLRYAICVVEAIDQGGFEPGDPVARVFEHGFVELLLEHQPLRGTNRSAIHEHSSRLTVLEAVTRFVDEHLGDDLTLERLARAGSCNVRTLQTTFSDLRRMSPLEYVRCRRLAEARSQLEAGEPDVTVSQIALKCGFHQFGRFAAYYRDAYGESPSETRARGLRKRGRGDGPSAGP